MTTRKPIEISQLLRSGELGELARRSREREAEHLVSASLTADGVLVVAMDSSAWAAKVRYRREMLGVERLRVRVVPKG
jgi:predicted nucleic acid-binding Zn ribbon protein